MSDLSRTAFRLRPRSMWEAFDSGILIWKASLGSAATLFALPFVALALTLYCVLPKESLFWTCFLLWWSLPLWDRILIHLYSVRFFRPEAGFKDVLKGLGRTLLKELIPDLTWRRFDPSRSVRLPLRVLENARGMNLKMRWNALERAQPGSGFTLTILSLLLELALSSGFLLFVVTAMELGGFLTAVLDRPFLEYMGPLLYASLVSGAIIMEPLYVAMGFSQYINKRVLTEGWDLQIHFQDFEKAASKHGSGLSSGLGILLALFVALSAAPPLAAQETDAPMDSLKTVLDSPDFGHDEERWVLRLRNGAENDDANAENSDASDFFGQLPEIVSRSLRFLLVAALALALVALIVYLFRSAGPAGAKTPRVAKAEKRPPFNPGASLAESERLFQEGREREAWAMRARVMLAAYGSSASLNFPADATEGECLSLAARHGGPNLEELRVNVGAWVGLAYAGRSPGAAGFQRAGEFCHMLLATLTAREARA